MVVKKLSKQRNPLPLTFFIRRFITDADYAHFKFTKTKGGTELGVRLDRDFCNLSEADFENGRGSVHLDGGLTLDYVKVKCVADLDLATLKGTGRLVKVETKGKS